MGDLADLLPAGVISHGLYGTSNFVQNQPSGQRFHRRRDSLHRGRPSECLGGPASGSPPEVQLRAPGQPVSSWPSAKVGHGGRWLRRLRRQARVRRHDDRGWLRPLGRAFRPGPPRRLEHAHGFQPEPRGLQKEHLPWPHAKYS